jgi:hypothetical protein
MPSDSKTLTKKTDEVIQFLGGCSPEERLEVFRYLRKSIPIHVIEAKLNTTAEIILEAIDRSSDITLRGVRGIITEVAFLVDVLTKLEGWKVMEIAGEAPYDFLIEDVVGPVNIQVKMQRKQTGKPLIRKDKFVVEVQRTRTGEDPVTGQPTRPYRFGQFDILAVSMQPSSNKWNSFMYTVGAWLLPRNNTPELIEVMQPIPKEANADWTDDLDTAIEWFRSGTKKTISPF